VKHNEHFCILNVFLLNFKYVTGGNIFHGAMGLDSLFLM
jgi:hypothetical protein